ncbi:MAG: hypothetical protein ABJN65_04995 [Parasphingorhabdus sp.]
MRFTVLLAMVAFVGWSYATPVQASGDGSCKLNWKLSHGKRTPCNNMAMLQPANDTRTNLMLLMHDQQPLSVTADGGTALFGWGKLGKTFYPDPEAEDDDFSYPSRCQTNKSGADAFVGALHQEKRLPKVERKALIEARQSVTPDCGDKDDGLDDLAKMPAVDSKAGKAFKNYLVSALAFYRGDFDQATIGFSSIVKSKPKSTWLREAALYMIARSELNRSQKNAFGDYGWFDPGQSDQGAIANAERGFNLYLKQYPDGPFANSARGLKRRVFWLAGNGAKLSAEYANAIGSSSNDSIPKLELIAEIDDKLLPVLVRENDSNDPMLAAMVLLYRMRTEGYDYFVDGELPQLTTNDLAAAKDRFAEQPALFEYLQAVHAFHIQKKPARVMQIIADDARRQSYSYLQFSRQVLRGMALEAVDDKNARGFWQQLIQGANGYGQRDTVELALAMNIERARDLKPIFANGSPISDQTMRDILLLRTAGPDLLLQQAKNSSASSHERDIALYTLLYKNLTRGRYSEFLNAAKLAPANGDQYGPYYGFQYDYDYGYEEAAPKIPVGMFLRKIEYGDYDCPQLMQTAVALNKNARNPSARICLADYFRLAGFDDYWLDSPSPKDQLGGTQSQFPGKPYSRLETYKQLISDRSTPRITRAYALYRAIWCYGSSGKNSCGGKEVPVSQRANWFRDLKRNHANTRWAKELKYYW